MDPVSFFIMLCVTHVLYRALNYVFMERGREARVDRMIDEAFKVKELSAQESWDTRETIRKYSPALAMRLDYFLPIEKPEAKPYAVSIEAEVDKFKRKAQPSILSQPNPPVYNSKGEWEVGCRCYLCESSYQNGCGNHEPVVYDPRHPGNDCNCESCWREYRSEPVAKMTTRYDPMTDTYKLYTTTKAENDQIKTYHEILSRQMLNSYGIPTHSSGPR